MNAKNMTLAVMAALFLFSGASFAQQTGAFNKTITFSAGTRTAAYYVPTSYNAANKYKLIIGLHGLGSDPQSMRTVLQMTAVNSPSSPVYNAIVIAPDGGTDDDFLTPSSDTNLLTACMLDAMTTYNIDPEFVYLNGISLGGRAALRYGLINWWRFRGIELWCPAIQTMTEANGTFYPYANSRYIPICITTGSEDGYIQNGKIPVVMSKIEAAGSAMASSRIVYGMGHQQPPSSYIYSAYSFINSHASSYATNDARISAIPSPFDEICTTAFTPTVTIQNKGKNTLTSATINYQLNGGPVNTFNWTGSLNRLGTANVTLPAQTATAGNNTFNAYTTMPNGAADAVPANDALSRSFKSVVTGAITLAEGFQGATYPPAGWRTSFGTDKVWTWDKITGVGAGGSSSCVRFDTYTDSYRVGRKYQMRTAMYDFSAASNPVLTYDYAYAIDNQAPTQKKPDTLVVYYSDNCGSTWTQLLLKGGSALSTSAALSGHFQPSSTAQWKKETITLTALAGKPRVMFAFEMHHAWGNLIYLDNITLTGVTGISDPDAMNEVVVYPNPTTGEFTVAGLSAEQNNLSIYDVFGKLVMQATVNGAEETLHPNLSNGIYFLQMKTQEGMRTEKLVVSK